MYKRLNLLASYAYLQDSPYFQDAIEAASPYCNTLIDSGAHTNHQIRLKKASGKKYGGREVTLEAYTDYLKTKAHGKVWQYITLDVIRNKQATNDNLQSLLDAGLLPMPVYVESHTEQDLLHLLSINPRICVAGGVGSSDAYIRRRYKTTYQMSSGRAKIHGLGYGRWPGTFYADIASCDSSSYNYGSRYGVMYTYDRQRGFDGLSWRDMRAGEVKDPAGRSFFIDHLAHTFKLTADELLNLELYRGKNAQVQIPLLSGCKAYLDFMEHVRENGKDYFVALANIGFMHSIVAVAAAVGMGDTSHKNIKDLFYYMDKGHDEAWDKGITRVVELLEKYTEWQIQPHSL